MNRLPYSRFFLCGFIALLSSTGALAQAVSREFSVSNFSPVAPIVSAVCREFSVSNVRTIGPINSAVSREFSIFNLKIVDMPVNQAYTREFSVYMPPYSPAEAADALRIAAGLSTTTDPVVLDRLNIINIPSSPGIDMLDAVAVTRLAGVAPPP